MFPAMLVTVVEGSVVSTLRAGDTKTCFLRMYRVVLTHTFKALGATD
jgi:hypothetical protein